MGSVNHQRTMESSVNAVIAALYTHVLWAAKDRLEALEGEEGLEAVEYALIAALIAASLVAAITGLRAQIEAVITNVTTQLGN